MGVQSTVDIIKRAFVGVIWGLRKSVHMTLSKLSTDKVGPGGKSSTFESDTPTKKYMLKIYNRRVTSLLESQGITAIAAFVDLLIQVIHFVTYMKENTVKNTLV